MQDNISSQQDLPEHDQPQVTANFSNDAKIEKEWKRCRVCGSTETAVAHAITRERVLGRIKQDSIITPCVQHLTTLVVDPNKPPLIGSKALALDCIVEVCMGCGVLRATHLIEREVQFTMANPFQMRKS